MRQTIITVPRDQWTIPRSQNNGATTRHLSPTELWIYDNQGTWGPYHAIGGVETNDTNDHHVDCSGDSGGDATSKAATQGSATPETHRSDSGKENREKSSGGNNMETYRRNGTLPSEGASRRILKQTRGLG
ncbi:hypothetical protein SAMD00023353_0302450 [Rosellinia necatrix]|uniref:Uncharacterized protein n=1 Tax=Rosellinia necatrix TaxID=77044 RepID=A0A1S8A558_ROSNE|nr:hypothetical protein SAMD00023353_0302450 [Rosellinia necatrix]